MPTGLAKFVRIAALLICAGVVVMVVDECSIADHSAVPPHGVVPWLALILKTSLAPIALAILLWAAAALLERPGSPGSLPPELGPVEAHRITDAIDDVRVSIANLTLALKTKPGQAADAAATGSTAPLPSSDDVSHALQRIIGLFEELRQLTLLDEAGRAARLQDQRHRQKAATLAEAQTLLEARQWAKADAMLQSVENLLGGDADVATARRELADRRNATEGDAISRARGAVEDLMAIGNWDQAIAAANELAGNFPENPEAIAMVARVARERELFEENTAQRLYDDVKACTERRQWQRGMAAARQLLERFPGHRRAEKIRGQWATIQTNAEIEQRQETEAKIQDLIRSKRFVEAVALAEEIIERYPRSPQADSLEEMLPKMRAMAIEQELDAEVS